MKRILLAIAIISSLAAAAKPAYKITLQVDDSKDTAVIMGYHLGDALYIMDTARNNGHGRFVFEGDTELRPGLYFFSNNAEHYFEFVVYHEKPTFTFRTKEEHWNRHMTVKGSAQNQVLLEYRAATNRYYDEIKAGQQQLDSAQFVEFKQERSLWLDSVTHAIVYANPDAMISKMLYSLKDIDVPRTAADGTPLSDRQRYDYLLAHYFDNMPLDDDFIVRTPKEIFYKHVMDYVEKYMRGMPPEMAIPLLDTLIERSSPAPEVFHWLVHNLTEHYLQSPVMVYDEIYVHLVMRYFATGRAFWVPPTAVDEEVERATKWERLLVGREAPELILFDTLHRAASLHHMPSAYTLLLFWSPTCGHCKDIVPKLYSLFEEYKERIDLTAFTILTEFDDQTVAKWKKFMRDHNMNDPRWLALNGAEANIDWHDVYDISSTPQVYLIDNSNHKILAKKIGPDAMKQICETLIK